MICVDHFKSRPFINMDQSISSFHSIQAKVATRRKSEFSWLLTLCGACTLAMVGVPTLDSDFVAQSLQCTRDELHLLGAIQSREEANFVSSV